MKVQTCLLIAITIQKTLVYFIKMTDIVSTVKSYKHQYNEDAYMVVNDGLTHVYVVCDGHGPRGLEVSTKLINIMKNQNVNDLLDPAKLQNLLENLDETINDQELLYQSGSTLAGVIFDTETRMAHMFTVGDSLVALIFPDGSTTATPLQNANNISESDMAVLLELQKDGFAYISGTPHESMYMMRPGTGYKVQPYSVIGDLDIKTYNPGVGIYPAHKAVGPLPEGSTILVASDGYYDNLFVMLNVENLALVSVEVLRANGSATELTRMAQERRSNDDITVILNIV